jgi:hypothetical protein
MADELERRLRDALRAYADRVEPPDDDSLRATTAPPRPALRRWRGAILAVAAAAAVVTGSLWAVSERGGDSRSSAAGSAGSAVSAPDDTRRGAPESGGVPGATSSSGGLSADSAVPAEGFSLPSPLQVGVAYPVDLLTHCGIRGLDLDGVWFAAEPPLVEGGNPPPGWNNPDQRGTVTLLTHDQAVFRDDAGHEVQLQAAESARPPLCQ